MISCVFDWTSVKVEKRKSFDFTEKIIKVLQAERPLLRCKRRDNNMNSPESLKLIDSVETLAI